MKYVKFYQVDAKTKVSIEQQPARTGPIYPEIENLNIIFSLESEYPTYYPIFIGTCSDTADLTISGVIQELTLEEYNIIYQEELEKQKTIAKSNVNRNRLQAIYSRDISYTFPGDSEPDGIQLENEVERQNLQDFLSNCMNLNSTDEVIFRPVSNIQKTLTAAEGITLGNFIFNRGLSIMQNSWNLKDTIDTVSTFEELKAINIYNFETVSTSGSETTPTSGS